MSQFTLFYLPLLLTTTCYGYVGKFTISVSLPDRFAKEHLRTLMVDVTDQGTFLLETKAYSNLTGDHNTFDPSTSPHFHKRAIYGQVYNMEYNHKRSSIRGYLGEDTISVANYQVFNEFGVVTETTESESAITNFDGEYMAGRAGFGRAHRDRKSFRDGIFEKLKQHNLCLSVFESSKGIFRTTVSLGGPRYRPNEVITSFKVTPDRDYFWRVPVTSLEIGGYKVAPKTSAILSTTLDEIIVPSKIFSKIKKVLDVTYDNTTRKYSVDCDVDKPLNLEINEKIITVHPEDYIKKVEDVCYLRINKMKTPYFILGGPIFTKNGICLDFKENTMTFFKPHREREMDKDNEVYMDDNTLVYENIEKNNP